MASDWDRRVIPRWRNSNLSSLLPETRPTSEEVTRSSLQIDQAQLLQELNAWRNQPSLGGAADLLNYAHISSLKALLTEPAEYILSADIQSPKLLKTLASAILNVQPVVTTEACSLENRREAFRKQAHNLKRRLYIDPRNSIALVDLARVYAAQGQNDKAQTSIVKAIALNPNHRFILRSGARFLVHDGKVEKALAFIERSPRTLTDPWLMATHISLETILGKTPKLIKRANALIDSGKFHPLHLSELSSSIATIRIMNGDVKNGKRVFNKALIAPNDNVVAQALWAAQRFDIQINIRDEWLSNPFSHEARYYQQIHNADFELAIKEASDWFEDEPFASRPLRAATYICCVLGHYEQAEAFALQGLWIDHTDVELKNNLVYALAAQNKLEDATSLLTEIVKSERAHGGFNSGHSLANYGMILFRLGKFEEGENFYKLAIEQFADEKDTVSQAKAAAYMARESLHSNNPNTPRLASEAIEIVQKYPSKVALKIMQMSKLIDEPKKKVTISHVSRWHYDPENKTLLIDKGFPFKVQEPKELK